MTSPPKVDWPLLLALLLKHGVKTREISDETGMSKHVLDKIRAHEPREPKHSEGEALIDLAKQHISPDELAPALGQK